MLLFICINTIAVWLMIRIFAVSIKDFPRAKHRIGLTAPLFSSEICRHFAPFCRFPFDDGILVNMGA